MNRRSDEEAAATRKGFVMSVNWNRV